MSRPKVSAVLNVVDDEPLVMSCLASLTPWVDEVVATDMGCSEATRAALVAVGARIITAPRRNHVEPARAAGIAAASNEWILVIDPDEVVPHTLAQRLLELATSGEIDAVTFSRRNYIVGREIMHSGWGMHPDRHTRFFRRSCLTFSDQVHEPPSQLPGTRVEVLAADRELALLHFNYLDLSQFLSKLDRYSSVAAADPGPDGTAAAGRAVRGSLSELWRRLVTHRAWRDGWRGIVLSVLQSLYPILVFAKRRELADVGDRAAVLTRYQQVAAEAAAAYAEWCGDERQ
jgi:hypothetical protein